jgi:hypothetical protein
MDYYALMTQTGADSSSGDDAFENHTFNLTDSPWPHFMSPISSRVDDEDRLFLKSKGAFDVLDGHLTNAILDCSEKFVMPQLPILSIPDWRDKIMGWSVNEGQVSLLLYQAVMLAGSQHLDEEDVMNTDYSSRHDLQQQLYKRVRVSHHLCPLMLPGLIINSCFSISTARQTGLC